MTLPLVGSRGARALFAFGFVFMTLAAGHLWVTALMGVGCFM